MREIVRLFSTQESRDELGIGQVRDALSDRLFPGISVIQTRARYFHIVPWLIAEATASSSAGTLIERVERNERRLIRHVLDGRPVADHDGLIGRIAGHKVKILPSTIYWSGLRSLAIVPPGVERHDLDHLLAACHTSSAARRLLADVPAPPHGFPKQLDGGFDLTNDEATWLRDRITTSSSRPTLLAHLATHLDPNSGDIDAPFAWDDPMSTSAPGSVRETMRHAEHFSLLVEGAALLYNLMLAEYAVDLGFGEERIDDLRERLETWADEVSEQAGRLRAWDLDGLWLTVLEMNPRLALPTRLFVTEWTDIIRHADSPLDAALSPSSRALVRRREERQKKGQSRFNNERLLRSWNGEAGTGRLEFRWSNVRRILNDLRAGLGNEAEHHVSA